MQIVSSKTIIRKPYTHCEITVQVDGQAFTGYGHSKCNPTDNWDTGVGESLAKFRAMNDAKDQSIAFLQQQLTRVRNSKKVVFESKDLFIDGCQSIKKSKQQSADTANDEDIEWDDWAAGFHKWLKRHGAGNIQEVVDACMK